jgi:hypothetical protein
MFPHEKETDVHTPSTNETKLKNGTQSCANASLASVIDAKVATDLRREEFLRKYERER